MDATLPTFSGADVALAGVAACLAEPARARMLCCLMDGHARTATELAAVAEVTASTTSGHLSKLIAQGLIICSSQGRHRYYSLAHEEVGTAVESLLVLAGRSEMARFVPSTPEPLREARRCYDHLAGFWAVRLHDHAFEQGWLIQSDAQPRGYTLTESGVIALQRLGVDVKSALAAKRRRLACACMDWSERRCHLGGALGAALLASLIEQRWLVADLDSRIVRLTALGRRHINALLDKRASR